jgi:hypothetical protein
MECFVILNHSQQLYFLTELISSCEIYCLK